MELHQVKDSVANLWQLRKEKDALKRTLESLQASIDEVEQQLIVTLDCAGVDRFDGDDCTVFLAEKTSVRVPKDPDSKQEFLHFIKSRLGEDVYTSMVTVNSATLNAWYREQEAMALERGELELQIPGLDAPSRYQTLSVRKRS